MKNLSCQLFCKLLISLVKSFFSLAGYADFVDNLYLNLPNLVFTLKNYSKFLETKKITCNFVAGYFLYFKLIIFLCQLNHPKLHLPVSGFLLALQT